MIIFDRLFGTFEPEKEEVVYGITHALNTWNPFYLQNHQFIETWVTAKKTPGLWNKIRVFLDRGPGMEYLYEFSKCKDTTMKFYIQNY